MKDLIVYVLPALLLGACGVFEETPEQAAIRAESERIMSLPVDQAPCEALWRRQNALQLEFEREAARQEARERWEDVLESDFPSILVPPRTLVEERAELRAVRAEFERRCGWFNRYETNPEYTK